jgi:uncharacterized protein YggE
MYDNATIAATAKGIAETTFESATFKATVVMEGKTGPAAKDKILPIIDKLKHTVMEHAEKAGIDTTRLKTTMAVDVNHNRNTGEFQNYKATYTIAFTGKNVVAAPAVHDSLTSIEGVQSPTPIYNLNESSDVHTRAFSDAAGKARVKFENQCKALGLEPSDYEIHSWTIRDEEHRGKMLSFTEGAVAKPIGLEPGKASLEVHVNLNFARKKPTP